MSYRVLILRRAQKELGALPENVFEMPDINTSPTTREISSEPIEPRVPKLRLRLRNVIKLLLYTLTVASALLIGVYQAAGWLAGEAGVEDLPEDAFEVVLLGAPYALAILSILAAHCGAHYWCARHYGVQADPPWVLPGFFNLSGIGGFVDTLPDTASSQKHGVLIGLMGPAVGAAVSTVFLAVGLQWSRVDPGFEEGLTLGEPLIFQLLSRWIVGSLPDGQVVYIHPVALAAWVGLIWAATHLIPIEPLDGGYIARALLGKRAGWVTAATLLALTVMGIWTNPGWLIVAFWLAIGVVTRKRAPKLYAFFFWRRPRGDEGATTLDLQRREVLIALLVAIAIFSLCFTIAPVEIGNGS